MNSYIAARQPQVEAFDCETYQGNCTLLSASNANLFHDDLSPVRTTEALDFIYRHTKRGEKLGFFFNLSFDAAAILKEGLSQMNQVELQQFRTSKEARFGKWQISYLINKALDIKNLVDRKCCKCFDIAGLMHDRSGKGSLKALSEKHLGETKIDTIDSSKLNVDLQYWHEHLNEIVEYCMHDAHLTKRLAEKLIQYCYETLEFYPNQFYSKASISKGWLVKYHSHLEKQFMYPEYRKGTGESRWTSKLGLDEADLNFIYQSYWGGIFDCWTFGHVRGVSEIDLTSAYPWATTQLPKLENLNASHGDSYDPDAVTGFYKIRMRYGKYPMPYREKLVISYPIDSDEQGEVMDEQILYPETDDKHIHYTTKPKLDFFQRMGTNFTVLDSLQFYGDYKPEFADLTKLFERRRNLKRRIDKCAESDLQTRRELEFRQYLLKIVMNACYGTMAQLRNGHGAFTNLIYASLITSMTHVKIYELLDRIGLDNVVFIATDGIMYKDYGQRFQISDELGDCKKEFENADATIFQNGVYFIEKDGATIEFRKRGMPTLTVEQLKQATGPTLSLKWDKPYRMIQALVSSDNCVENVSKIGQWLPHEYTLSLEDVCRKRTVAYPFTFERFNAEEVPSIPIMDLNGPSQLRVFPKPKSRFRHAGS